MSGAGVFAPRTLVITTFVLFTYIMIEFSSKLVCLNEVFRLNLLVKIQLEKIYENFFALKNVKIVRTKFVRKNY